MTKTTTMTMVLALATACATDEDDDAAQNDASSGADVGDAGGSADEGESSTGVDIDALWDCSEPMVVDARPLVGPGYDAAMGGLVDAQDTYVVATTKILVPPQQQEEFLAVSGMVTTVLDGSPGMVAYGLGFEPTCGFFRTLSVYRSQEDMIGFVLSDAHTAAMARYSEFAITGKTASWQISADAFPPTWTMADDELATVPPLSPG